jgi:hypothetical protein
MRRAEAVFTFYLAVLVAGVALMGFTVAGSINSRLGAAIRSPEVTDRSAATTMFRAGLGAFDQQGR